jgi:hypothetical protein
LSGGVKRSVERKVALIALWAALAACGGSANTLEGSLADETSLAFDHVLLQQSGNTVAVSYLRSLPAGGGSDLVLKVVVDATGLDLSKGLTIDLTQALSSGAARGSFTRAVSGDSRGDFPPLTRGNITFDGAAVQGKGLSGHFNALWSQAAGGSIGAGRTAFGNFSGTLQAAQ